MNGYRRCPICHLTVRDLWLHLFGCGRAIPDGA